MTVTVAGLLQSARKRLEASELDAPLREVQLVLGEVLGLNEAQLLARDDLVVAAADYDRFEALFEQRLAGRPMAYVLGSREFFGREFAVDERVLIPRPETEHLVEAALALPLPGDVYVIDVGTGSGAIAVTLKLERPSWTVAASDRSIGALAVARHNAAKLQAEVSLFAGDLLGALAAPTALQNGRPQLVVSNPPYIADGERAHLSPQIVEYEPSSALFAGALGLDFYRLLVTQLAAADFTGWLAVEIGHGQSEAVSKLFEQTGFDSRSVIPDYAGINRVVVGARG